MCENSRSRSGICSVGNIGGMSSATYEDLMQKLGAEKVEPKQGKTNPGGFGFDAALKWLKEGFRLRRKGWNGKGIFIKILEPHPGSEMSSPFIYIDTTGLQTDNPNAPKSRVPWLASQTDLLATDWEVCR